MAPLRWLYAAAYLEKVQFFRKGLRVRPIAQSMRSTYAHTCISIALAALFGCGVAKGESSPEAAPAAAAPAPVCGQDRLPDCPLQGWMKANLQGAVRRQDFGLLTKGFERLPSLAPEDMAEWAGFARAGADAAKQHDISAVREVCAACHEKYRPRYRANMRNRPLDSNRAVADTKVTR
jgi:hypothetical protein